MNQKLKKLFQNILLFLISTIVALVGAELIFRWMIFGNIERFKYLKNPTLYTNTLTENYWKLYYRFGGAFQPLSNPHPLLSWVGHFNRQTYNHEDSAKVGGKRPILIYGDSFIMCVHTEQCFQTLFNADTSVSKNNYMLNYGVAGYGVDQTSVLCSLTVKKFDHPFVIFSVMPDGLDRSILKWRTGQKPYYAVEDNRLVLRGIPIYHNPKQYYDEHPPTIRSYMWARFKYSQYNQKKKIVDTDKEIAKIVEDIKSLNEKIILEANESLKNSGNEYVFLLFDELWDNDGNWRQKYLDELFVKNNIPYINAAELVQRDLTGGKIYDCDNYIIHGNGHPTTYYNNLVVREIKKYVKDYKNYSQQEMSAHMSLYDENSPAYFENKIRTNKEWFQSVRQKAEAKHIPVDSMIRLDALYMLEQQKNKK